MLLIYVTLFISSLYSPWGSGQVCLLNRSQTAPAISKQCLLVAQSVKNLPVVQETWVWSLGQEDTLEEEMATHSSILTWRIPWTEQPGGLQPMGSQELDMT